MEIKNVSNDRWNVNNYWNGVDKGKEPDLNPYDVDVEVQEQSPPLHEAMKEGTCGITFMCTKTCTCICHTYGVGSACCNA
jgi:hypothetical protein